MEEKKKLWWEIVEKMEYKDGRITFIGIPYTIIPASILPLLHKRLREVLGPGIKAIITEGAARQSYEVVDKALKKTKIGYLAARMGLKRVEIAKKVIDIVTGEGWGLGTIIKEGKLEKGEELIGKVENSFEAEFYGESDEPVCRFITGALTGGARAIWRDDVIVEEIKCKAKGDPHCEFRVKLKKFYEVGEEKS